MTNDKHSIYYEFGADDESVKMIERINELKDSLSFLPKPLDFMETCEVIFEIGLAACEENHDLLMTHVID